MPTYQDILEARQRIAQYIKRPPVMTNDKLDRLSGVKIYLMPESLQVGGSFKFRGAMNAVLSLPDAQKGFCTHSSGNHAIALSLAAQRMGLPAWCVMPRNATLSKRRIVEEAGATIIESGPYLIDRESKLSEVVEETNATFIHPYDHEAVLAGAGTSLLDMLDQVDDLDAVICPVGGGGLLSGTSVVGKHANLLVYGAEPELVDDACRGFKTGVMQPQPMPSTPTIAEGLRTSLCVRTFDIIRENVEDILTVSEDEIKYATQLLLNEVKIVVEPSGAVSLAVVLKHRAVFGDRTKVGVILSGGNLDFTMLDTILDTAGRS